jgi:DNA-binding response OmpR family regulator
MARSRARAAPSWRQGVASAFEKLCAAALLRYLVAHPGRVLSKDELMSADIH